MRSAFYSCESARKKANACHDFWLIGCQFDMKELSSFKTVKRDKLVNLLSCSHFVSCSGRGNNGKRHHDPTLLQRWRVLSILRNEKYKSHILWKQGSSSSPFFSVSWLLSFCSGILWFVWRFTRIESFVLRRIVF